MVSVSVNSTSVTEARIVWVRSMMVFTCTDGGIDASSRGSAARMRSTVSMTLAPGCLLICSTIDRPLVIVLSGGEALPA
ncbi:hypothetical protein G6F62_015853 [Rhizopus arrhizus]|nr:hypothetical protein G6F23_016014 [Rhizopus arrhizus]KAG1302838.1 hypothetical protein G6F62_015853 [Rhizopus arrhizus]